MQEKYRKRITWWFEEFLAGSQIDRYVELFPELDSRLSKFAIGIFIWNMIGQIDIDNPDDVSRVRLILKVLDLTPGYDFFDEVFNEADIDTVCGIIGISKMAPHSETPIASDYDVTLIKDYEHAKYYKYFVSWCIVISEESYNDYTVNGNRFCFCENGEDWVDVPCQQGVNFPYDNYGFSLIAVEISPENKIVSVTSRWNTYAGDTGEFLSEEQLKDLLGDSFHKLMQKPED